MEGAVLFPRTSGHIPRGGRDPFISLALGLNILSPEERISGLGGMLIREVSLGSECTTEPSKPLNSEKVVFRQEINDPLRIEKFQRLEKWLHPLKEGQ